MSTVTLPIRPNEPSDKFKVGAPESTFIRPPSLDSVVTPSTTVFKIHNKSIWQSLLFTLQTLEQGRDPNSIPLLKTPEVSVILNRCDHLFRQSNAEKEWTNTELKEALNSHAVAALLDDENSPSPITFKSPVDGFLEFLETWLTRVVNFLTQRKCLFSQHNQAGLHDHYGEWYYHPNLWAPEDEDNWRFFDQFPIEQYPDVLAASVEGEQIPSYMTEEYDESKIHPEVLKALADAMIQ